MRNIKKLLKYVLIALPLLFLLLFLSGPIIVTASKSELLRAFILTNTWSITLIFIIFVMGVFRFFVPKKSENNKPVRRNRWKLLLIMIVTGFISFHTIGDVAENVVKYLTGDIQEKKVFVSDYQNHKDFRTIRDENRVYYRLYDKKDEEKYEIGKYYVIEYIRGKYNLIVKVEEY